MAKANVVVVSLLCDILLDANLHDPSTPLQMKHNPHVPLEHGTVAMVSIIHFICDGFNVVADWCVPL